MNLNFLFMDECYSKDTAISSLTGLLVPAHNYPDLRIKFYDTLQWAIRPEEHVVSSPPELHTNAFLSGHDDIVKLQNLEHIVEMVVSNQLRIYRVGYYVTKETASLFRGDKQLMAVCWFRMIAMLQPEFESDILVPVMDGFNTQNVLTFSGMIKSVDVVRAAGLESSLSFNNTQNILGEVFYADSKFSIFTQVADVVSYLRHVTDWAREGLTMTDFKKQLLRIADNLTPALVREEIVAMNGSRPIR